MHDSLEVFACRTNLVSRALPQDRHSVVGDCELAGALGDHAIDVDLDLGMINCIVIVVVVSNDGCILYVDEVWHGWLLGGRQGHYGDLG